MEAGTSQVPVLTYTQQTDSAMKQYKLLIFLFSLMLAMPVQAAIFKDFKGKPANMTDYIGKGKWVIVMIWASDCHLCNKEAKNYDNFHQQHKNKDAIILGLSTDGKAKLAEAKSFIKRHDLHFPNIIGENRDVAIRFQNLTGVEWTGTPSFLVYSPEGELAVQQSGAVPVYLIEEFLQQQQKPR